MSIEKGVDPKIVHSDASSSKIKKGKAFNEGKLPADGAVGLTAIQVQLLRRDFGKFSDALFKIYRKTFGEPKFEAGQDNPVFWDMQFGSTQIYPEGIAWFGENLGRDYRTSKHKMVGTPMDYVQIHEDYEKIKVFVKEMLAAGIDSYSAGHDRMEVDPMQYITWLYSVSQSGEFKKKLERAVVELLGEELPRQFDPLGFEKQLKELPQRYDLDPSKFLRLEDMQMTLFRIGLDYPNNEKDARFKEYVVSELKKTERPITLEEYLERFAGSDEQKRKNFATGEPVKRYNMVHIAETSVDFKAKVKGWYVEKKAMEAAVREFSPQFNLLSGLVKIVWAVGRNNNGFAAAYPLLKNKTQEGFLADAPPLDHGESFSDIFADTLRAMMSVQKDTELRKFWLQGIQNDKRPDRIGLYVAGLLGMHKQMKDRCSEIPEILQAIENRDVSLNQERFSFSPIGFVAPVNLLDSTVGTISEMCFKKRNFHHIDIEQGAFRFLASTSFENGTIKFNFASYTKNGSALGKASLDLKTNSSKGNSELEDAVRAYVDENGYLVSDKLHITSLEGKTQGKSLLDGKELDGKYEGIIGLNNIKVAFRFDPRSDELLVSLPISNAMTFYTTKSSQSKRMKGQEEAAEQLSKAKELNLLKVGEVGALIDETAKKKLEERDPMDPNYSLMGTLNDQVSPAIAQVVKYVLVERGEGLWK